MYLCCHNEPKDDFMSNSFYNTFSVKNFRSYGERGVQFVMAPITILTGCNSSGKSSLVKAQLLLGEVLKQIRKQGSLNGVELNVADKELKMGRFDKVVHNQLKDGIIEMRYTVYSDQVGEVLEVAMWFKEKPNDLINNGYLCKVAIIREDGSVLYARDGLLPLRHDDGEADLQELDAVVKDALNPPFLKHVKYVDSASVSVCRLYTADDGDDLGRILRSFLDGNRQHVVGAADAVAEQMLADQAYVPSTFLNKWIHEFGVGDAIRIKGTEEGLGIMVFLEKDGELRLLADEGYGITQLFALLLQIEVSILKAGRRRTVDGRGEERLEYEPSFIYVEEPENHLHPKFQSLLADLFVEAFVHYNIQLVVETHSEYMIRKMQVLVAAKEVDLGADDVSVNYIENDADGVAVNRRIVISDDGGLVTPFGSGFFDEADGLSMNLLRIKAKR